MILRLRDALYVQQNYEPLAAIGAKLRTVRDLARNAEIINQQFVDRIDVAIELRIQIGRTYPVFDLVGAEVDLHTDFGSTTKVIVSGP